MPRAHHSSEANSLRDRGPVGRDDDGDRTAISQGTEDFVCRLAGQQLARPPQRAAEARLIAELSDEGGSAKRSSSATEKRAR
jgi:hypothetical protein